MDIENTNLIGGSLQISTDVIAKIAKCAALEIDGVAAVSFGMQNKKVSDILERVSLQTPAAVEMKDGIAEITLQLVVAFGARIPVVAEKVQENVKASVQNMTNIAVSRVNVVITGLANKVEEDLAQE
ncbi:MAG: Asp23/Gls24 family envelope stress response protein [Faecalibacterium sp.]